MLCYSYRFSQILLDDDWTEIDGYAFDSETSYDSLTWAKLEKEKIRPNEPIYVKVGDD